MKLKTVRDDMKYYANQANILLRNLAFAGLGVIWIFRPDEGHPLQFPNKLLWAGALLVVSLMADLVVYVGGKYVFTKHYIEVERRLRHESGGAELDLAADVSSYNAGQLAGLDWAYRLKAATVLIAYALILCHVLRLLAA